MLARLRVTLVALLLMVVALVVHTASQDSVAAAVAGTADPVQASTLAHTPGHVHSPGSVDSEQFVGVADEPAPACPSDRRPAHEDSGTPVSRLAATGFTVAVPAVFSEPASCVGGAAVLLPDRSVPVVQASGVDLCTELCVSRR